MPNPNNQNENNLSEVRKILDAYENQLNVMHFNNAELNELHVHFREALHDLNTATDHFYTRDEREITPLSMRRNLRCWTTCTSRRTEQRHRWRTGCSRPIPESSRRMTASGKMSMTL